ncbi:MAG: hypothetical protein ACRCWW_19275 [Scandinavium sp.]|uniref:hypothetical protein n=1 Tax=Scandinavium sp. TaxID=2830653 RepID=UPI003F3B8D2E
METVVALFHSYPIFLWITGCKILFIVSDQNGGNLFSLLEKGHSANKKCRKIIALVKFSRKR